MKRNFHLLSLVLLEICQPISHAALPVFIDTGSLRFWILNGRGDFKVDGRYLTITDNDEMLVLEYSYESTAKRPKSNHRDTETPR